MGGIIFRLGVSLENRGKLWKYDWLIRLGLNIREYALNHGKLK